MEKSLLNSLLCPPGSGVYTVHTAKEIREKFQQALYSCEQSEVEQNWSTSLYDLAKNKTAILGIPSDNGGGILRGANWGPLFLREKLYDDSSATYPLDLGDVRVIPHLLSDNLLNEDTIKKCRKALYDDSNSSNPVSPLSVASAALENIYSSNPHLRVLGLGGDHSVSHPLTSEWIKKVKKENKRFAIIHFDAHTDLSEERLGIDICFGSWAYHILKDLQKTSDLLQIGIRSSGKEKDYWESKLGIQQFWSNEITHDFSDTYVKIKTYLEKEKIEEIYISFDIDAIDSRYASATGTAEPNGIEPHHAVQIIKMIQSISSVTGADLVEVAPFINSPYSNNESPEPFTTLQTSLTILNALLEAMNEK